MPVLDKERIVSAIFAYLGTRALSQRRWPMPPHAELMNSTAVTHLPRNRFRPPSTCEEDQAILPARRSEVSMSRTVNGYDNAATASFFSTVKQELRHDAHYVTREAMR
ncbi:MAG: hypothetical protein KDA41_10865 [Planctomycetales bacterium]|nr:hypothetical protein [Planctomycetales bacterium]